ncbi:MAG: extracellular solute-binding protein, partial [Defluviitaleaceae bacterium]|nr:extracellular solute-binding protein [Defluviitaleaceae bacterium]
NEITQDSFGNDIRPTQDQLEIWQSKFANDYNGNFNEVYFYLPQGKITLSLVTEGIPFKLSRLVFEQVPAAPSYAEYLSNLRAGGYSEIKGFAEIYEGEIYHQHSDSILTPDYDRGNPLMSPFSFDTIQYNFGGGRTWMQPSQSISWKLTVPEDGLYTIAVKYRNPYMTGMFSARRVFINGVTPFEELENVRFNFTNRWTIKRLGDDGGGEPFLIFLNKGDNIISMEYTPGDLSHTLGLLQTALENLNKMYLNIVMLVGNEPDPFRDYNLERRYPELPDQINEAAEMLMEEADRLVAEIGMRGETSAALVDMALTLMMYAKDVENFTYKGWLRDFADINMQLSARIGILRNHGLDIDFFVVSDESHALPRTSINFFQAIAFQFRLLMASYRIQRNELLKQREESENSIRVWIGGGNDHLTIVTNMINEMFTPATNINVNLILAYAYNPTIALINATAAGIPPDVYINADEDIITNLAMRTAIEPVQDMPGYAELIAELIPGSETPFKYKGKVYGIPVYNAFNVMFIRDDIFSGLGIPIPETWDDIKDITQVLRRNNMNSYTVPPAVYLMYQNGVTLFNEDLTRTNYDSQEYIDGLTEAVSHYTELGVPLAFDSVENFRTGEMPILFTSYNFANTLRFVLPEINGLWSMYLLPGTLKPDGTIDRTQTRGGGTQETRSGVTSGMSMGDDTRSTSLGGRCITMFRNSNKRYADSWEFMKWFAGHEAQTRYSMDLEAVLGLPGRHLPVNWITLNSLPWTQYELDIFAEAIKELIFLPLVPGNYAVQRAGVFAFSDVYFYGLSPREAALKHSKRANDEMDKKYMEFERNQEWGDR